MTGGATRRRQPSRSKSDRVGHAHMRTPDCGAALLLVLGYLTVLMLFSGVFVVYLHRAMDQLSTHEREQKCLHLAEGGLNKAIAALRAAPGAYRGEEETPLGEGYVSIAVTPGSRTGEYRIVSRARLENSAPRGARLELVADVTLAGRTVRGLTWKETRPW